MQTGGVLSHRRHSQAWCESGHKACLDADKVVAYEHSRLGSLVVRSVQAHLEYVNAMNRTSRCRVQFLELSSVHN